MSGIQSSEGETTGWDDSTEVPMGAPGRIELESFVCGPKFREQRLWHAEKEEGRGVE